jgi:hypothetical protein
MLGLTSPHARMIEYFRRIYYELEEFTSASSRDIRNPHGSVRSFIRWEDNC